MTTYNSQYAFSGDLKKIILQLSSQALEVWPLNPLKCLSMKLLLHYEVIAMYTTINLMIFRANRASSACAIIKYPPKLSYRPYSTCHIPVELIVLLILHLQVCQHHGVYIFSLVYMHP